MSAITGCFSLNCNIVSKADGESNKRWFWRIRCSRCPKERWINLSYWLGLPSKKARLANCADCSERKRLSNRRGSKNPPASPRTHQLEPPRGFSRKLRCVGNGIFETRADSTEVGWFWSARNAEKQDCSVSLCRESIIIPKTSYVECGIFQCNRAFLS